MKPLLILIFSLVPFVTNADSDLNGMVANKCSGAIVDIGRNETSFAVVLTNGHCIKHKLIPPNVFVKDEKYTRSKIEIFNNEGASFSVTPRNVLYATMEGGDLGLIEIGLTYKELKERGVKIFTISDRDAEPGEELFTASGYWKTSQTCIFKQSVPEVLEERYVWKNSMVIDSCNIKSGWSGSPLISKNSGKIVGVLNTANENGERCTLNNPCERDSSGTITVKKGRAYGAHSSIILSCLSSGRVNLEKSGCKLFHDQILQRPHDDKLSVSQKFIWLKKLTREYPAKRIDLEFVDYDMFHMSTSALNTIKVNKAILDSYSLLELLFYTCHELGHHFGDKKVSRFDFAVEAEADYFGGACLSKFVSKWEQDLKPYLNQYRANRYERCGRDVQCLKIVDVIQSSFSSLLGTTVFPDKAIHDRFPDGINTNYPDPNCRTLSAISGLLEVDRPTCWYNPKL
jgi:hypothetical protein